MKSKEEIEDIANKEYGEYAGYHKASFTNGYTKCQEDMIDKKYTEKQLLDAMSFAECYIIEHDKPLFLKSDGKPTPDCLEYINSLNKKGSEQLCECSSKILPNGKIQLHLCRKCNEELFKES